MPYESILIVEDGSCPEGANSYASLSEADAYALPRGLWTATEDEAVMRTREQALLRSSDWLNSLAWKGQPVDADREMAWPRTGIGARGVEIASDTVPACVKTACIEAACLVASGTDLFAEVAHQDALHAAHCAYGHEDGGLYLPVIGGDAPGSCPGALVAVFYLECHFSKA